VGSEQRDDDGGVARDQGRRHAPRSRASSTRSSPTASRSNPIVGHVPRTSPSVCVRSRARSSVALDRRHRRPRVSIAAPYHRRSTPSRWCSASSSAALGRPSSPRSRSSVPAPADGWCGIVTRRRRPSHRSHPHPRRRPRRRPRPHRAPPRLRPPRSSAKTRPCSPMSRRCACCAFAPAPSRWAAPPTIRTMNPTKRRRTRPRSPRSSSVRPR